MDNTCICCGRIIPEGRHICLQCERGNEMQSFCGIRKPSVIKTNGDRVRSMSNAELSKLLGKMFNVSETIILRWLDQEAGANG